MYNLVAFQMYTCGGLMCDILNNKRSHLNNSKEWHNGFMPGSVGNIEHAVAKTGVNYDSDVLDIELIKDRISQCEFADGTWIGTHCYPTQELVELFDNVICITTATSRSRMYRWARAYNFYVEPMFSDLEPMEKLDMIKGHAKQIYLPPFEPVEYSNVVNLEFSDIIDNTPAFVDSIGLLTQNEFDSHVIHWRELNSFLYDENFWHTDTVKRYHEAEYEQKLSKSYRYH